VSGYLVYGFVLSAMLFGASRRLFAGCNIIDGRAYGDCGGVTINQGYLSVTTSVFEPGIIRGATVRRGGVLELSGVSDGNIVVEKGGTLTVTGVVDGAIINKGGHIVVEGTAHLIETTGGTVVIGGVVDRVNGNGLVKYRKGAVVGGMPRN
jgi:hypothetical protein